MEIWHRITFHSSDNVDHFIKACQVKFKTATGFGGKSYHIHVDVSESHPAWPQISALAREKEAFDIDETVFSTSELLAVEWVRLKFDFVCGYPQPENDMSWMDITYDNGCPRCGTGYRQKAPFHLAREPRMGKRDFTHLFWTYALFCTPRVFEGLKAQGIRGYEVWPAIIHRWKQPSKTVSQLVVPGVAGPGLADDALPTESCGRCDVTRYGFHRRGYMHLKREALLPDVDFQQTYEWFGSGGESFRELLISNRVASLIIHEGWRGVRLKPIELV